MDAIIESPIFPSYDPAAGSRVAGEVVYILEHWFENFKLHSRNSNSNTICGSVTIFCIILAPGFQNNICNLLI